jgi:glycosyltransferase involved in cell wall biosynthesis
MTRPALVSIVIPCHNEERFIAEAIESALGQTYVAIEVIVVDDGSRDRSRKVIESFGSCIRPRWQPQSGAPAARNNGARSARGDYIMFLDGDDAIAPGTIEALLTAVERSRNEIAACRWVVLQPCCEGTWRVMPPPHEPRDVEDSLLAWLEGYFVPPCSLLWPTEVFRKTGGWDETLAANQDGDLAFRAFLSGARLRVAKGGCGYYRQDDKKVRISSSQSPQAFLSRFAVLERVRLQLLERGDLEPYKVALGRAYYHLALRHLGLSLDRLLECRSKADVLAGRQAIPGGNVARVLDAVFGIRAVKTLHQLDAWLRRIARNVYRARRCDDDCVGRIYGDLRGHGLA